MKKRRGLLLPIVLTLILILSAAGCGKVNENAAAVEGVVEQLSAKEAVGSRDTEEYSGLPDRAQIQTDTSFFGSTIDLQGAYDSEDLSGRGYGKKDGDIQETENEVLLATTDGDKKFVVFALDGKDIASKGTIEKVANEKAVKVKETKDKVAKEKAASAIGAENTEPSIDEDGTYTSKDDVALYLHIYGDLPDNFITKKEARQLGWSGGSLEKYAPGMCIGGDRYGNFEGILPDDSRYWECDIDTLGKKSRGAKRIVYSDDGFIYYTGNHYKSFELMYEP